MENQQSNRQGQEPVWRPRSLEDVIDQEKFEMEIALLQIAIQIAPYGLKLLGAKPPENQDPVD